MRNNITAEKIKALRIARGLSQAELANQTELSLRTIQRIENSETEARGDSLIRLAKALNVTAEELTTVSPDANSTLRVENNRYLVMLNLSAICFLAFPLLGIIVPLVMWSLKKGAIKDLDIVAKRLINFQISWVLFGIVGWIVLIVISVIYGGGAIGVSQIVMVLTGICVMYAINLIYIIVNSILLSTKRLVVYKPAMSFF